MSNIPVILIDWGSTNLRAWLCNSKGDVLDSIVSEKGITRIQKSEINNIINEILAKWLNEEPTVRIIMAGMIGSDSGLGNTPYIECPANIASILPIKSSISNKRMDVWIVPGVSISRSDNHNVMRGEETQLVGAWKVMQNRIFIMPGTHSKWVCIQDGLIEQFHTSMTGELYNVLMNHSLIGKGLPEQNENITVFSNGLIKGLCNENWLSSMFEVRSSYVLNQLNKQDVGEYLSGLLIGSEIKQMIPLYKIGENEKIVMIAEQNLSWRYKMGFEMADIQCEIIDGKQAFLMGMRGFIDELA